MNGIKVLVAAALASAAAATSIQAIRMETKPHFGASLEREHRQAA